MKCYSGRCRCVERCTGRCADVTCNRIIEGADVTCCKYVTVESVNASMCEGVTCYVLQWRVPNLTCVECVLVKGTDVLHVLN